MPVIQLPKDTRWGDLGTGLGQVIGGALEGYANKRADQSVAQIMEDPLLTEPAKLTKIMKEVPNGLERYKGLVTSQVLQATVKEKTAEAAKNQAAVDAQANQDDIFRKVFGLPSKPAVTAPTTNVLPQAPAPVAPVAPVAAPAATPTSVIPDVLAGGASPDNSAPSSVKESPAAGAAPATVAPTASAAPTQSGAIVGTLSAPPSTTSPTISPIDAMINQRATASNVTFTPEEHQSLVLQTAAHWKKTGGNDVMAPVDAAIKMKQAGAEFPSKVASSQASAVTAEAGARTAVAKGAADLAEQQARLEETTAKTESARQVAAAGRPVEVDLPKLEANFPTFSPEQRQAVSVAGRAGGLTAVNKEISRIVEDNAKGAGLSTESVKFARDAASYGAITERFANEMVADPARLGLISTSGIRAKLESYGIGAADQGLQNLLQSQRLAAATAARENGNWGVSGTNLSLSKQTSANIDKTPLANLMMFAGTAAQKIGEAEVEKAAYAGNPRAQAAIDQAVQPWKNIQRMTDTLNSTTVPVDPEKPTGAQRDVMYFMGNQVSPNTMVPIVRQDNTMYTIKPKEGEKTKSLSGIDIFNAAREVGVDPAEMLRRLGGKP